LNISIYESVNFYEKFLKIPKKYLIPKNPENPEKSRKIPKNPENPENPEKSRKIPIPFPIPKIFGIGILHFFGTGYFSGSGY